MIRNLFLAALWFLGWAAVLTAALGPAGLLPAFAMTVFTGMYFDLRRRHHE